MARIHLVRAAFDWYVPSAVVIKSTLQTLQLEQMVPGVTYMLVITKSPGANTLQFKHLGDPDPVNHPAHVNVATPTVVTQFLCPSPTMALVWTAPPNPEAPYYVSVLPMTQQEF